MQRDRGMRSPLGLSVIAPNLPGNKLHYKVVIVIINMVVASDWFSLLCYINVLKQ